ITDMNFRTVDRCMQLFGGYGYMLEYPISKAFVDFRVESVFAGSNEIMKTIIAKRMGLGDK
ncbi:acyl-CoA dehydrogenase, partial [Candidatus Sumerlaeota bacterium]|nr:acyl-CoA dehydrogenase [Candidatus Sumerlaeota bacterium]